VDSWTEGADSGIKETGRAHAALHEGGELRLEHLLHHQRDSGTDGVDSGTERVDSGKEEVDLGTEKVD
jgi:hypothetical protein